MEEFRGPRIDIKNNKRLPHTVYSQTASINARSKEPVVHSYLRRYDGDNSKNDSSRNSEASKVFSQFHFAALSSTKKRRVSPPNFQLKSFERIRENGTVSPHKYESHSRLSTTAGLDVQNRFESSLFSSQNRKTTPALSSPNLRWETTRNDLPSIWTKDGTKNLLNSHQLGGSDLATKKYTYHNILGRYFACPSKCSHSTKTRKNHDRYSSCSRVVRECQKIYNHTTKKPYISGGPMEDVGQLKVVTYRKNHQNHQKSPSNLGSGKSHAKRNTESRRSLKLCQFRSTTRKITPSSTSKIHEHSINSSKEKICTTASGENRTEVVARKLPFLNNVATSSPYAFSDNRCFGPCMGRSVRQCASERILVHTGANASLQSKRDASHPKCNSKSCSPVKSQLFINSVRQPNCSCSPPKGRRDEISSIDEVNASTVDTVRSTSNIIFHSLHSGQIQRSCRSFITPSTPTRMASLTEKCGNNIQEMGFSSNRPFRFGESPRGEQLCVTRPERPQSALSQRFQCTMELPTSLAVPATLSGTKGSVSPQPINGNIPDSSAAVAQSILESRSQSESSRSPVCSEGPENEINRHIDRPTATERRRSNPRNLEMWGWTEEIKDWNSNQISLLKSSWRDSTLKTYSIAWKRWLTWAKSNNVDEQRPSGSHLARYLADLHLINGFSHNTIMLHKSVVSSLCNVEMSSQLSSHVMVKHVLKAISLKNPKHTKPPIWDISDLVKFLSTYSIDTNNMYQTSRHTAILLLLCSGRRIHDLTLLRVDPDHYIESDNCVTLWPDFGSKTDSSNYKQSGWKLIVNNESKQLDPIFWVKTTVSLLKNRRDISNSYNLFMTVRGPAKPASRTVIAGWIRHLFKNANIQYSPGSTRSAVASKNWLHYPLDEVLARGNWRSASTFHKFYRREVQSFSDSNNITQLFTPIH